MGFLPGLGGVISKTGPLPGQQVFTSSGTFVVPDNCTVLSLVAVGCGGDTSVANRGGDLRWNSALAVTAGESLTVEISTSGGQTRVRRSATDLLIARGGDSGTSTTTGGTVGGGNGGSGGGSTGGAGGAGGYSGNGGDGGSAAGSAGSSGSGGGGGGGGGYSTSTSGDGGGGGGVGLLGEGSSGAGGVSGVGTGAPSKNGAQGEGGSGGLPNDTTTRSKNGGAYGGGAYGTGNPGGGAVRFIWGEDRAYPSTNTGDF